MASNNLLQIYFFVNSIEFYINKDSLHKTKFFIKPNTKHFGTQMSNLEKKQVNTLWNSQSQKQLIVFRIKLFSLKAKAKCYVTYAIPGNSILFSG